MVSPRRRARCNRHDARAGIVALLSCCLARLSNAGLFSPSETAFLSLLACTQQGICRGAVFGKPPRQGASTEHPLRIQNLSIFSSSELSPKQPQGHDLALQLYHCSIGFPNVWLAISATLRTPTLLVTTHHDLM